MTYYTVSSGVTSSGVHLYTVSNTSVISSDALSVYSGGTASSTYVASGAVEVVFSGGSAVNTDVASGGTLYLLPGASATGTTANYASLVSGIGTVMIDGSIIVIAVRGNGFFLNVSSGWTEFLQSGAAVTISGAVYGTDIIYSGGSANSVRISAGGFEIVSSGGQAKNTSVGSGGVLLALPGAVTSGSVAASGGQIVSTGVAITTQNDGVYTLDALAATSVTRTISPGQTVYVLRGGSLVSSVDSGTVQVFSGGSAVGDIVARHSWEYVYSGGVDSNVTLRGGSPEEVYGSAIGTVVSSGSTQVIQSGGTVTDTVVSSGGAIDLTTLVYNGGTSASIDAGSDVLTVGSGSSVQQIQLASSYAGEYFHASEDATGGTVVTLDDVPCYCRGTRIETAVGEVAVEALAVGDLLRTHGGALRPIRWIGQRAYRGRAAAARPIQPVLIRRHAITEGLPRRDLYVSPRHALFLDDALVAAEALVNFGSIMALEDREEVEYFHLELDSHDVILAEGLAAESYLDDGNRGLFGAASAAPEGNRAAYCAPRLEHGAALAALRARLALRAQAIGHPLPRALRVPLALGCNRVLVPREVALLRLVSPAARPPGERRRLGSLIAGISIGGVAVDLADPRLRQGFHPPEGVPERRWRWTDGDAVMRLQPSAAARWCLIEVAKLMAPGGTSPDAGFDPAAASSRLGGLRILNDFAF